MKTLKKIWRPLCGLYAFIYLPCFFAIEKAITLDTPGIHILNTELDDKIPFLEIFIIPYVLWFFYVVCACVFMVICADNKEFLQFALSLMIGMSLFLIISLIYPNGITLRPDYVSDSIFGKIIKALYSTDTSTNVFPSIHVYNSLAVHIALNRCKYLKNHKVIRGCSLVLCILICLSTVFLKQHSIVDAVGGIVLMIILYVLIYVVDYRKILKKKQTP